MTATAAKRPELDKLLRNSAIWRGGARTDVSGTYLPTGWSVLDEQLPGGGWPQGALTEVLSDASGTGEVSLFIPALATLSQQGRWMAWINTPWVPVAPVLAARGLNLERVLVIRPHDWGQALWASEQLLGCAETGAVLLWAKQAEERRLRRLQLAAESGAGFSVLFRPAAHARQSSPAALRLSLEATGRGSLVNVIKCRGRRPGRPLLVA